MMKDKTRNFVNPMYATKSEPVCLKDYSIKELQNAIYDKQGIPRPEDCIDADLGNGL